MILWRMNVSLTVLLKTSLFLFKGSVYSALYLLYDYCHYLPIYS